jgi:CheY-like chemotaxis protein
MESRLGAGSTFTLTIPARHPALAAAIGQASRGAEPAPLPILTVEDQATRLTVLVIDDEAADRDALRRLLAGHQLHVVEAATAAEGRARARQVQPDLVFLDLGLPDQSGFEVLTALRADPETERVPVVVVTAMELSEQQRRVLEPVTAGVLCKANLSDAAIRAVVTPLGPTAWVGDCR